MKTWIREFLIKVLGILQSRKFWALAVAIAVAGQQFSAGNLPADQFVLAVVTAVVAYIFGTALEDGLARHGQ